MRRSRSGFTMVEMVVSVVLLGVGISACVACIRTATQASARAEEYTAVELMAREKLSELELSAPAEGEDRGDFGPEREGYSWETETRSAGSGLREVRLAVVWGSPESPRRLEFTTYVRHQ